MKKVKLASAQLLSCLVISSAIANEGGLISLKRCQTWGDSLSNEQADQRVAWAKRCSIDLFEKKLLSRVITMTLPDGSVKKAYPIYGVLSGPGAPPSNPKNWFAPTSANTTCERPSGYEIVGFCAASCYAFDQLLMTEDGMQEVLDAKDNKLKVEALSSYSDKGVRYKLMDVKRYISSIVSGEHKLINFETQRGKELKVTSEHPFVLGSGEFIAAKDIKKGHILLNSQGEKEEVIRVETTDYYGKVYNLEVDSSDLNNKIINANGLMSGDMSVQNSSLLKLNQMLHRLKFIPKELVE